ncbi:type II secretion system GspH family protein [bacterium]|nr:type II secretion system GspH family protein [bacterium]
MTSLNSKLQLAVLNRKKGRNLLEKGFTLVELMIVIVIVGILSAVALPNFLNQTSKAKATEAQTKISAALKNASTKYYAGDILSGSPPAGTISTLDATSPCADAMPTDLNGWVYENTECRPTSVTFIGVNSAIKDGTKEARVEGTINPGTGLVSKKPELSFS